MFFWYKVIVRRADILVEEVGESEGEFSSNNLSIKNVVFSSHRVVEEVTGPVEFNLNVTIFDV